MKRTNLTITPNLAILQYFYNLVDFTALNMT